MCFECLLFLNKIERKILVLCAPWRVGAFLQNNFVMRLNINTRFPRFIYPKIKKRVIHLKLCVQTFSAPNSLTKNITLRFQHVYPTWFGAGLTDSEGGGGESKLYAVHNSYENFWSFRHAFHSPRKRFIILYKLYIIKWLGVVDVFVCSQPPTPLNSGYSGKFPHELPVGGMKANRIFQNNVKKCMT